MNLERLEKLEKFHENDPNDPFTKYALALEYQDQNIEKAFSFFEDLLISHPEYLPTYYQAAHFYTRQQEREKAEEIFRKGIELAKSQKDHKAQSELSNAYQNFLFDEDYP